MTTVTIDSIPIERPTVYGNTTGYRVAEIIGANIATPSGSTGQTVTLQINVSESNLPADLNYAITATASQACSISYYHVKATNNFQIILTPLDNSLALSAGTVDFSVVWNMG